MKLNLIRWKVGSRGNFFRAGNFRARLGSLPERSKRASGWPGETGGGLALGLAVALVAKTGPDPKLLSPWPLPRLPGWAGRVNECLTKQELAAVRLSAQRGKPLGDEAWVESMARRLNLESTMRPRGRDHEFVFQRNQRMITTKRPDPFDVSHSGDVDKPVWCVVPIAAKTNNPITLLGAASDVRFADC